MKVVLTGSLGHINKTLVKKLVAAGHGVTVISSSPEKREAIEAAGATAAIGSVTDVPFLTQSFTGADVVYTMVPGNFGSADYRKYHEDTGRGYAEAIRSAGVKKVVNLSSIGAELSSGTGPIAGLHDVEEVLNKLEGVDVQHLRAGFFYTNYFNDIHMIKGSGIMGANYSADSRLVLVHPDDIAAAAASAIQGESKGKQVTYVASDERVVSDIVAALGASIGKPDLKWVQFTDEQAIEGMKGAGFSQHMAETYAEMSAAVGKGILVKYFLDNKIELTGKIKLEDFAKQFAAAFEGSAS